VHHRVLVDGPKASGKSALIAKWVNPATDISTLAASQGVTRIPHLICEEPYADPAHPGRTRVRRHSLVYIDVPGEKQDVIRKLVDEQPPEIMLFVADPLDLDGTVDRITADRFVYLYGAKDVHDSLKCCILYVSKADKFDPGTREQILVSVRERTLPLFQKAGLDPILIFGSALTGENLPVALGEIYKHLGLDKFLFKHPSLTA
jgi:hypothetical protein